MVWNALMRGAAANSWGTWRELERLHREMDRFFADPQTAPWNEFPPIELWTGENAIRLRARIPGLSASDIDLSVVDDTVTLKGERRAVESEERNTYHRRERELGRFARTIQLPFPVESGAVAARFQNGILEVDLPRATSDKPMKIAVQGT